MTDPDVLAQQFESQRAHLRAVALRMLGSGHEAGDAVQETRLRLSRSGAGALENLGGWLPTVVARVWLDMLRARSRKREVPPGGEVEDLAVASPEDEALLVDSVGLALLVVLDTLEPAERLAFVLHDMFAVPFDQIAPIVGRTPVAGSASSSPNARRSIPASRQSRISGVRSSRCMALTTACVARAG